MIRPVATSRRFLLSVLLAALPVSACNFKDEKGDADADTTGTVDPATPVTYEEIRTQILEPSCISCHSTRGGNDGGVNLESYAAVKAEATDIKRTTVDSTRMPKGDSLSGNLRALLGAWIAQGAPE